MSREGPLTENSSLERLREEVSDIHPKNQVELKNRKGEEAPAKVAEKLTKEAGKAQ